MMVGLPVEISVRVNKAPVDSYRLKTARVGDGAAGEC